MRIIKRLYSFILKSFLPLFAMTFFIVLFIILMQFLWKNIDQMVGKGLTLSLLGELFFYAALSMVPMALPLAILLASLMTFGNLGEKFELTAMKASGISLVKAMSPLIVFISMVAVGAFFFSNNVIPKAQVKMWTLLFSMRMKSPELEIPEGVFYDQIPGYNLFVKDKNRDTGMLYEMMVYDVSHGGDNSTVLIADSGRLAFTPDMKYLYLHLWQGEQFENLREQKSMDRNVPFRREEFKEKEVLIPFDANFNRLDEGGIRSQYVGKNFSQLSHSIDSISAEIDSVGRINAMELEATAFPLINNGSQSVSSPFGSNIYLPPGEVVSGEKKRLATALENAVPIDIDTLIGNLSPEIRNRIFPVALGISQRQVNDYQFKSLTVADNKKNLRLHKIELMKKFTLSVACLVFFFIGAPLGAIIRKGGLGMPMVISVLLFVVYYIIDNTGTKMARDGRWFVWEGVWLSTFILAPLGILVTYKAMNDSAVFDGEKYKLFLRKLLGLRSDRKVSYKEVILNDISLPVAIEMLNGLKAEARRIISVCSEKISYSAYFSNTSLLDDAVRLGRDTDTTVDYLTDCRNPLAVNKLMDMPVVRTLWIYSPASTPKIAATLKWFFPFGLPVYLFGLHARKKMKEELERVSSISSSIISILENPA